MKTANKPKFLTFNDGVVNIYSVENTAQEGDSVNETLSFFCTARFDYKTVGINRQFEAMQYQINIKAVLQIPINREISTQHVAVINDTQYRIVQVQHIKDTKPAHSLLSLAELEVIYDYTAIS